MYAIYSMNKISPTNTPIQRDLFVCQLQKISRFARNDSECFLDER